MPNRSYRIGYTFERRVKFFFEAKKCLVFRQGKSAFPDLICLATEDIAFDIRVMTGYNEEFKIAKGQAFFVECKVNKYLSAKEKQEAESIARHAPFFVAWRDDKNKMHIRKVGVE